MKSFREQQADQNDNKPKSLDELSAKSPDELYATLLAEAHKAKANGTLNGDTLQAFYDQMAPMLSPEQRDKMAALINAIL